MHAFTDGRGRTWHVAVTVLELEQIRAELAVNLFDLLEDNAALLTRIFDDLFLAAGMLGICCRPQFSQHGSGPEDFASSLSGDVLGAAHRALLAAIIDFFPDPQRRDALRQMVAKAWAIADQALRLAVTQTTKTLDQIDPESTARTLSGLRGNSRGSAGSMPATIRYAKSTRPRRAA